jgi:hypothetical protein
VAVGAAAAPQPTATGTTRPLPQEYVPPPQPPQQYAPPPPQPYTPPPPAPRRRSRTPLVVLGLLLLLAGAGVGIAAAAGAFKTSTNTVITRVTSTGQSDAGATVSTSDVTDLLTRYENAYSGKDLNALDALFAPDFKRRAPPRPDMARAAALREYARQFGNHTNPRYSLSNENISTGPQGATATADYTIAADNAQPASGRIGFAMVMRNGRLMIAAIEISSG